MRRAALLMTAVLGATLPGAALSERTQVNLQAPHRWLPTSEGTVNFPFDYQMIDPSSGPALTKDPVVVAGFDEIASFLKGKGYQRPCNLRLLYALPGSSLDEVRRKEEQWVKAVQNAPTRYQLIGTADFTPVVSDGERITGRLYSFDVPGKTLSVVYAFKRYEKAKMSWVLECKAQK